jgi:hypothetical protein
MKKAVFFYQPLKKPVNSLTPGSSVKEKTERSR